MINDVTIHFNPYNSVPVKEYEVEDRTTSGSSATIKPGEPVKIYTAEGGNYAVKLADGDPAVGTDIVLGVAASESTETSSVDGVVKVQEPLPGMVWKCAATSSSNLATGIKLDCVTFDYSSSTYTVDEDEGSDEDVHGLRVIDYDSTSGNVYFQFKEEATLRGSSVA